MASGKKMARGEPFKTPECRISFAHNLFKPRTKVSDDGTSKESWECTLIFDKKHRPALEAELKKVIDAEWPKDGMEKAKKGLIRLPLLAGDGKEAYNKTTGELNAGLGPDVFFVRVSSNNPVPVHYLSPTVPATQEEVYSGCYGFAVVNAYCWHNQKNGDGVSLGINFFQKKRDGDRLGGDGGRVNVDDYFEKIEDDGSAPMENSDGAASLFG